MARPSTEHAEKNEDTSQTAQRRDRPIDELAAEELKTHAEKLGRWRKTATAALGDWRFALCCEVAKMYLVPLTHFYACVMIKQDPGTFTWTHGNLAWLTCRYGQEALLELQRKCDVDVWGSLISSYDVPT